MLNVLQIDHNIVSQNGCSLMPHGNKKPVTKTVQTQRQNHTVKKYEVSNIFLVEL